MDLTNCCSLMVACCTATRLDEVVLINQANEFQELLVAESLCRDKIWDFETSINRAFKERILDLMIQRVRSLLRKELDTNLAVVSYAYASVCIMVHRPKPHQDSIIETPDFLNTNEVWLAVKCKPMLGGCTGCSDDNVCLEVEPVEGGIAELLNLVVELLSPYPFSEFELSPIFVQTRKLFAYDMTLLTSECGVDSIALVLVLKRKQVDMVCHR